MHTLFRLSRGAFFSGSILCTLLSLFFFIVVPMRHVQAYFGWERLGRSSSTLLFATVLGGLFCWLLYRVFDWALSKEAKAGPGSDQKQTGSTLSRVSRWQVLFQIGVSVFILFRAGVQIQETPMNWDELTYLGEVARKEYDKGLNPLKHMGVHSVSAVASAISMEVFGIHKVSARLPALLFTLFFLLALNHFCFRYASAFTAVVVFSHLCVNRMATWYMHSSRGYISLMAATLLLMMLFTAFTRRQTIPKKFYIWVPALMLFSFLCHGVGNLFSVLILVGFTVWLYLNRQQLPVEKYHSGCLLLLTGLITLVCISPIVYLQYFESIKYTKGISAPAIFASTLSLPLGLGRVWWGKLLFLLGSFLFVVHWGHRKKDFVGYFTIVFVLFFLGLLWVTGSFGLAPRWLLPFAIPFVLWVCEASGSIQRPLARGTVRGFLLFSLGIAPMFYHWEIYSSESSNLTSYDRFLKEVQNKTAPTAKNCYSFEGDRNLIEFSWSLYFSANRNKRPEECTNHYHVQVGDRGYPELIESTLKSLPSEREEIYREGPRAIYRVAGASALP